MRDFIYLQNFAKPSILPSIRRKIEKAKLPRDGVSAYVFLHQMQGGRCFYCNKPIRAKPYKPTNNRDGYTVDHVIPRAAGYSAHGNAVLCCAHCNTVKAARMPTPLEVAACRQLWAVFIKIVAPAPQSSWEPRSSMMAKGLL